MNLSYDISCITRYFPGLTPQQIRRFTDIATHYLTWNAKVNLISRKDITNLYLHHVLHSLSIAKVIQFQPHARVLDVGTGGGFPGLPLAILFPQTHFTLVDSIGKKINAVQAIAAALQLNNVTTCTTRIEKLPGKYDFIVARAVTSLPILYPWIANKLSTVQQHSLANGLLYLKGTQVEQDLDSLALDYRIYAIARFFEEAFFVSKAIIYIFPVSCKASPFPSSSEPTS